MEPNSEPNANVQNAEQANIEPPKASTDAKVLLIAGQPLNEPIVQHGPFVMNSAQEIHQALSDFRAGRLGEMTPA